MANRVAEAFGLQAYARADWLAWLRQAGFVASAHALSVDEDGAWTAFVGRRAA